QECINQGGSVTGEHGIGVEKIDFMAKLFSPEDLAVMVRLRTAFNPEGRGSPAEMLPTAGACAQASRVAGPQPGRRAAADAAPAGRLILTTFPARVRTRGERRPAGRSRRAAGRPREEGIYPCCAASATSRVWSSASLPWRPEGSR